MKLCSIFNLSVLLLWPTPLLFWFSLTSIHIISRQHSQLAPFICKAFCAKRPKHCGNEKALSLGEIPGTEDWTMQTEENVGEWILSKETSVSDLTGVWCQSKMKCGSDCFWTHHPHYYDIICGVLSQLTQAGTDAVRLTPISCHIQSIFITCSQCNSPYLLLCDKTGCQFTAYSCCPQVARKIHSTD